MPPRDPEPGARDEIDLAALRADAPAGDSEGAARPADERCHRIAGSSPGFGSKS